MLKDSLKDFNKLFDAKVWQSIAGEKPLNSFILSIIARLPPGGWEAYPDERPPMNVIPFLDPDFLPSATCS